MTPNKVLIIYPHFPPSNLAGVHRPRLFAQHLSKFGWEPVVLTVSEEYYEEKLDENIARLLPKELRIEKVSAFRITKPRLVGDIGLRAFFQLYKKAKYLINTESFDLVYISIPSFYTALLGRWLHHSTGIKYGIDYIDPWVHEFPGSNKIFSRHWFSTKIAKLLEPIAVKKASLITGVADAYYEAVLARNPDLRTQAIMGSMPYGGEQEDHEIVSSLSIEPYLFKKNINKIQLVYAGAMLPKAYGPLEKIFCAIAQNSGLFENIEFHFIGTGKRANDPASYNVKPLADKYGLWEKNIFEYAQRIPYFDVLVHLSESDGVFILGSTEPHYTPSKSYQAVLSHKPILAVLHKDSTAVSILTKTRAAVVLAFNGEKELNKIENSFADIFQNWLKFRKDFDFANVDMDGFSKFSASEVTKTLSNLFNLAIRNKPRHNI